MCTIEKVFEIVAKSQLVTANLYGPSPRYRKFFTDMGNTCINTCIKIRTGNSNIVMARKPRRGLPYKNDGGARDTFQGLK